MASLVIKSNTHNEDDEEEDLEALRLAALQTMRKKQTFKLPPVPNAIFKPHVGNPNLIAIIPEGTEHHKHPPRQNTFRHPLPRLQQFRPHKPPTFGKTLKLLPQVQIENKVPVTNQEKHGSIDKEEVSTKFSRFEDMESESEDESDEKKESESSDESEDVLALEDDDDSLEALMAQMEHEIEVGIDAEPNKKDKKKTKGSKSKEKDGKVRGEDKKVSEKIKTETKTAVVEPTVKESIDVKIDKFEESKNSKEPSPPAVKPMSPIKIHPLKESCPLQFEIKSVSPKRKSPDRIQSKSPIRQRSVSPLKRRLPTLPPDSPKRERSPTINLAMKSRSPIKQRSHSPRRSPVKSSDVRPFSPLRSKSPRRLSPDRRSPFRKSPDWRCFRNKSPSPYYKMRDRDYGPINRSRSPVRRRSLSPRKTTREPSPKYYKKRSRSPWSPVWRPSSPKRSLSPRYRSRSPVHRRSLSPRNRKYTKPMYTAHSPAFRNSPKRRSPTQSPRRSKSPRKRDYSPKRRITPPRRDLNYRRNSISPKRKKSPLYKKYSPPRSPKHKQRSLSPRRNVSPRRKSSPIPVKEIRPKVERRSRTPSLSLSPSPPRESKEPARRYKSPLRPRKESMENTNNRISRGRRGHTPDNKLGNGDNKERRKPMKTWDRDRDNRQWDRKVEDRRKERTDKLDRDVRRERENKIEKVKRDELKEEVESVKVTENPVFEARRKKFESTAIVEPTRKKIRLVNKRRSSMEGKTDVETKKFTVDKEKKVSIVEDKKIMENSVQTEDDLFSGREEIDQIDNFLNEDVLDLSAEVWSSDDELFPKVNKSKKGKKIETELPVKQQPAKERISLKKKVKNKSAVVEKSTSPPRNKTANPSKSKSAIQAPSPTKKTQPSPEQEEERKERDNSDLRAELSRRREERLTKAGSLHEKLPARLLQSAFESALGKKKTKKEEKSQKSEKDSKKKESASSPVRKEKSDGRRVLVLKRPAPVRLQSAHINVTFPKDRDSESESSYSSSSSDESYALPATTKRKLPVYMRLGTTQQKHSSGRKVKLPSRRSQV